MTEADVEQEWVEAPGGWGTKEEEGDGGDGGMLDLFGKPNPSEDFTYNIMLNNGTTKSIRLHGYKLDSDEVDRSTGVTLWQAAPRLADYLQQQYTEICKGSVMELGAGLGLVGLTAHHLGVKHVMMTDGDIHALKQLRENVLQNCGDTSSNTIECKQLLWGSPTMEIFSQQYGQFDTILGADVIYTPESVEPLLDTVACLLKKPNGRFVLSRYNKWNNVDDAIVIDAAKRRCLDCTRPSEGIYIFHWNEK